MLALENHMNPTSPCESLWRQAATCSPLGARACPDGDGYIGSGATLSTKEIERKAVKRLAEAIQKESLAGKRLEARKARLEPEPEP